MGTKQEFFLIAAIMFIGSGVLSFYCIRDGLIRKSVRIGALRKPLKGRAAVALSIVWLVWAAIGFGLGVWLLMQGLAKAQRFVLTGAEATRPLDRRET